MTFECNTKRLHRDAISGMIKGEKSNVGDQDHLNAKEETDILKRKGDIFSPVIEVKTGKEEVRGNVNNLGSHSVYMFIRNNKDVLTADLRNNFRDHCYHTDPDTASYYKEYLEECVKGNSSGETEAKSDGCARNELGVIENRDSEINALKNNDEKSLQRRRMRHNLEKENNVKNLKNNSDQGTQCEIIKIIRKIKWPFNENNIKRRKVCHMGKGNNDWDFKNALDKAIQCEITSTIPRNSWQQNEKIIKNKKKCKSEKKDNYRNVKDYSDEGIQCEIIKNNKKKNWQLRHYKRQTRILREQMEKLKKERKGNAKEYKLYDKIKDDACSGNAKASVIWDQIANYDKKHKSYSHQTINVAISLWEKSSKAYELTRDLEILTLPHQATLHHYLGHSKGITPKILSRPAVEIE